MLTFAPATKKTAKLRLALIGPAGAGKTYTALAIASHLGSKIAVMDTEHGSASKYAGIFPAPFDVIEPDSFAPAMYAQVIQAAEQAGYDVLIIDSLSHAWSGKDGALEQVDRAAKRSQGNSFGAWRDVTPQHNDMVEAIVGARIHIIATMRAKMEYVQQKDERTGKTTVRKIGLQPVQRDGLEYEFDVVADLDTDNNLIIGKTRCPQLAGAVFPKAGEEVAAVLRDWLTDGVPAPEVVKCDCGKAARLVRGKSGSGYVCAESMCDFKQKVAGTSPGPAAAPTAETPAAPAEEPDPAEPVKVVPAPHPADALEADAGIKYDGPEPERSPLTKAVAEKRTDAAKPPVSGHVTALAMVAKEKGLAWDKSDPKARAERLHAINQWLMGREQEPVATVRDMSDENLKAAKAAVEDGSLTW